jgi:cellulose synthase (UDP-forming)
MRDLDFSRRTDLPGDAHIGTPRAQSSGVIAMVPPPAADQGPARTLKETIDADDTLEFVDTRARRLLVRFVSVFALCAYVGYLIYRAFYTINYEALTFSLLVYFAEVHGFFSLFFYFHEVWAVRRRRVVPPPAAIAVDVFVTTYNEDVDLLRQTLRAAIAMRYPHGTYVLDDGRRPAVRALADELGCTYVTRSDNAHAKAGNWNNAFRQTRADVIATFDADHVPRPDFLERTLGFFRDPKVALVQVPQLYHNLDSVQHKVSWKAKRMYGEQDAFFNLVMPGKDHWNAAFFCGTGAVLRRAALGPHGGILTGTITEDLHTSLVLHTEGWKSVYLNELLVTGLAPVDLKSFEVQRLRWAEGNLKVAGYVNPLTAPGLSLPQRISYFASLYHWTIGIPKLIYYAAPPWMRISGTFPIAHFDRTFLAVYLGFLASLIVSYQVASRGKGRLLLDELFNMVSFFTLVRAVKRVLIGRGKPAKFEVTPKGGSGARDTRPIMPHVTLLLLSLLAITWSLLGLGFGVSDDAFGAGTAIFWTLYNVTLMLAVLRIGGRPAEKRAGCRFRANFAVEEPAERGGSGALGVTADISDRGCSLLWPSPLTPGDQVPLRVHFGSRSVDWTGAVMSAQGRQGDGWHRYGVQFLHSTQADVDLINDSVFSLVVPELFQTLSQPVWLTRQWRRTSGWLTQQSRSRARRQAVRVPVRVRYGGGSFVATARDLSTSGVSVAAPRPIPAGTNVELSMFVPGHAWHGTVSVARCVARPSRAGFDTWMLGLHFEEQQDEAAIESFRQWDAA